MKNRYVNLITFAALVCILFLQGIWLYNTYKLLDADFKKNISAYLFRSTEKELQIRDEDPELCKWQKDNHIRRIIDNVTPYNDPYPNHRYREDYNYKFKDDPFRKPFSLEKVDSIFKSDIKKDFGNLNHSILITDSLGNQKQFISSGEKNAGSRFAYKETLKLRNIDPEYITLAITSPYKIIFGKMALMLVASFILAVIVVYGLILQTRTISEQNKIAQLRQDFTHSIIHDMKNPITAIIMGIGALKSGRLDNNPKDKNQYYKIITREGEHILKLSNEILEIAKFEKGEALLSKQSINLSDLLESLKEKYLINTRKKIHFHMELNESETIRADLHFINEAFDNLIDNAIKYSKEDEEVEIRISSSRNGNTTRIIFRDNGIGIAEKDQKIIFQKFERAMAVIKSQNKVSGFGLGLNFVYQVVKAHGGTIKVNSRLGSYTEFIINLPYNEDDQTITD